MVWADLVLAGAILGMSYAGFKRGLIQELFDLLTLGLSFGLALRLYRPLGEWFHSGFFSGWSEEWCLRLAFMFLWVPLVIGLMSLGFHVDRVTKENERLPEAVQEYGGGMLAIVKSIILAVMFVAWLNQSDMMLERERPAFRRAPVVQLVRGLNSLVKPVVYLVYPTDMARDFIKRGMDKNF